VVMYNDNASLLLVSLGFRLMTFVRTRGGEVRKTERERARVEKTSAGSTRTKECNVSVKVQEELEE
jgi:hypothetical protein